MQARLRGPAGSGGRAANSREKAADHGGAYADAGPSGSSSISGMLPGEGRVLYDLGAQLVERAELALGPDELVKRDRDLLVVEVARPVEQVGFDAALEPVVDRGPAA